MKNALIAILLSLSISGFAQPINLNSRIVRIESRADTVQYSTYGQSNAGGEGVKRTAVDSNLNNSITMLSMGLHSQTLGSILRLDYPVQIPAGVNKVGLHLWIGKKVRAGAGIPTLMWGNSLGGTPIANFLPGHGSGLWNTFRNNYNSYLRPTKRPRSRWQFHVHHQGESDDLSPNVNQYIGRFRILADSLRALANNPNLPIFVGGFVPSYGNNGLRAGMQAKIRALPDSVANVYYVSSCWCETVEDGFHFKSESYERLGNRYGDLINHIVYRVRTVPETPKFNVWYTSTTVAQVRIDYTFSPIPITRAEVYVGGVLRASIDNPTQDITNCGGIVFNLSGFTISGQNVYVRVQNEKGWATSATQNTTYSNTLPTPDYGWLCNETSGTNVAPSHGAINATLNVNASTVTSTMTTTGQACFNLTGSQFADLALPIVLHDTVSIAWETDPTSTLGAIMGDEGNEQYIMPAIETDKVGLDLLTDQDRFLVTGLNMTLYHKVCMVIAGHRALIYVDGVLAAEEATSYAAQNLLLSRLFAGHASFRFSGKINKIRIWQGKALQPGHVSQL
jgi:hypothetical protein